MNTKSNIMKTALAAFFVIGFAFQAQAQEDAAAATDETATQESAVESTQETAAPKAASKTIAETIDPETFSTLWHAVNNAGLTDTLNGDGPFTVFAPNDTAFGTVNFGVVQNLFDPANKDLLAAVLKHHVVQGKIMAADVAGMTEAKSVLGETLKIEAKDGKVSINGVNVSTTDIECTNGVIHVIDGVFMPSQETVNKIRGEIQAAAQKAMEEANKAAAGSSNKSEGSETKSEGSETKSEGSETKSEGSETKSEGSETKSKGSDSKKKRQ